ncbi:MAG: hypothetical protein K2H36_00500 [Clostridia bacterium]|nr:hypothetical protein [Clostridia bacterium]
MKNKIGIGILLASIIVSIVLMAVFIPHYQNSIKSSGGVLELEFEDGSKQYVAIGGRIYVEMGSKCKVRAITPTSEDNYVLSLKNGEIAEDGIVIFDKQATYFFDIYLSSGNFVAEFFVEAVQ